jgi:putative transposase
LAPRVHGPKPKRAAPANKLSEEETAQVLHRLNSEEFADKAPAQIGAILLDQGTYLCSESSMYRILRAHSQVRERRRQATHPAKKKPELTAAKPNDVWSWDITKLRGPAKGVYYDLMVIIDLFSRYVLHWHITTRESGLGSKDFIADAVMIHGAPGVIHADRGTSMTSKPVAELMFDLGITRSHSRPRVSNDNPYSEAQFKTTKYHHRYPGRFGSRQDAVAWASEFFLYYNHEHRHTGIGLHTPASVYDGTYTRIRQARAAVLKAAYAAAPQRFSQPPQPPAGRRPAWINQPQESQMPAHA